MTDRPRTWTIWPHAFQGDRLGVAGPIFEGNPVRVVEWDRERVVPIIEQALAKRYGGQPESLLAEAVFDALNGDGGE